MSTDSRVTAIQDPSRQNGVEEACSVLGRFLYYVTWGAAGHVHRTRQTLDSHP